MIRPLVACALVAYTSPVAAQALFDAPWMAYNAGYFIEPPNGSGDDGRWPLAATAADLNGDGHADLALARGLWNSGLAVLLSDGAGGYGLPSFYGATYAVSADVAAADLDSDGDVDLVTADGENSSGSGQKVSVFRNQGDGTFESAQGFPTGGGSMAVVAADYDNDGDLDLATADYVLEGGSVSILLNDGAGTFAAPQIVSVPVKVNDLAAGDLDGDGDSDLVVAHDANHVTVLVNDGSAGFAAPILLDFGLPPAGMIAFSCVALGDLDGDGDLDIAAGHNRTAQSTYDAVVLFDNAGDGTFGPPHYERLSLYRGGPSALTAGDLNGDGRADLVAASAHMPEAHILLSADTGGFAPAETYIGGDWVSGLALGDTDADGALDLVTADLYSMAATVHRNDGDGRFGQAPRYEVNAGAEVNLLDTGDLDGDGDLDAVAMAGIAVHKNVYVLLNDGAGAFTRGTTYTGDISSAFLRDLTGDGTLDLLYNGSTQFHIARGRGDGTFESRTDWFVGACYMGLPDAFDFDGDGDLDVVSLEESEICSDPGTSRIFISGNRGDGTFDPPVVLVVDGNPHVAAAGHFDGDGKLDFVTAHQGAYGSYNFVNVHLGNGDLTFAAPVFYEVGFGPSFVEAVDLNGDGQLDIVTGNIGIDTTGDETVSVLMGNGTGSFADAITYYAPYAAEGHGLSGLAVGDPDGDGDLDLLTSSRHANDVAFYENRGDGTFAFSHRYGIGESASGIVYADFTGDGISDVAALTKGYTVSGRYLSVLPGRVRAPTPGEPGASSLPSVLLQSPVPNPASETTRLRYRVARTGTVRLAVYDVLGREVALLVDGERASGTHEVTLDASRLAIGTYVVRLQAGGTVLTCRVTVAR